MTSSVGPDQTNLKDSEEMPPPLELTLVLAATRDMGIGRAGTLPWTGLKKEMAYFARVTKRPPRDSPSNAINAVVMGRKTWDSIPPRFRPLKDRLNVVLSRSFPELLPSSAPADTASAPEGDQHPLVVRARSLPEALTHLRHQRAHQLGHVFVIGGAQIYDAALALPETRRVLLTSVQSDFECDTYVSKLRLGEEWKQSSKEEHDAWVGEEVPAGAQEESGTSYEFQMWERN